MHALLNPGDTILGLSLAHGGHLTHGMRINFSGKLYHATAYEVSKEDYLVDMDAVAEAARTHRPKMIIAGWSAYPRQLDFARFRAIADEVDAVLMVDMAHFAGLVAAGVHPSPVPHAHVVTSTTHKTLGGPRGGIILCNDPAIARRSIPRSSLGSRAGRSSMSSQPRPPHSRWQHNLNSRSANNVASTARASLPAG